MILVAEREVARGRARRRTQGVASLSWRSRAPASGLYLRRDETPSGRTKSRGRSSDWIQQGGERRWRHDNIQEQVSRDGAQRGGDTVSGGRSFEVEGARDDAPETWRTRSAQIVHAARGRVADELHAGEVHVGRGQAWRRARGRGWRDRGAKPLTRSGEGRWLGALRGRGRDRSRRTRRTAQVVVAPASPMPRPAAAITPDRVAAGVGLVVAGVAPPAAARGFSWRLSVSGAGAEAGLKFLAGEQVMARPVRRRTMA